MFEFISKSLIFDCKLWYFCKHFMVVPFSVSSEMTKLIQEKYLRKKKCYFLHLGEAIKIKNKLMLIFLSYGMLCWPCCLSCIFATLHINDMYYSIVCLPTLPFSTNMPNTSLISIVVSQGIEVMDVFYPAPTKGKLQWSDCWLAAHNYLFAVGWCIWMLCCGQYGKGFTGRTERILLFVFVYHFCGNIKNTWVLDRKEEGQWKWMSLNTDECRSLIMSIHSKPLATVLIEQLRNSQWKISSISVFLRCQDVGPLP